MSLCLIVICTWRKADLHTQINLLWLGSNPKHAAYGASKAGLHARTRAVAVDHGPQGIRCNAVAPGWIDTELNEDFIESMEDPMAFRAGIGRIHPLACPRHPYPLPDEAVG